MGQHEYRKLKTVFKELRVFRISGLLILILVLLWIPFAIGFGTSLFQDRYVPEKYIIRAYISMAVEVAVVFVPPIAFFVICRIISAVKLNTCLKTVIQNTKKYLPDISESLLYDVENDIAGGMKFIKKGNLGISGNYIIGSLTLRRFTPVIIPVSEVVEVLYESFEGDITGLDFNGQLYDKSDFYQYHFFRLRNGNYVPVLINDENDVTSSIQALREAGIETVILNRIDMKNALLSKDKMLYFSKEKERIIVRSSDSMHIIPLPVTDGCVSFEKLFYDPQDRLIAAVECGDGSEIKYIVDEAALTLTKDR